MPAGALQLQGSLVGDFDTEDQAKLHVISASY